MTLVEVSRRLRGRVDRLRFGPPVSHVYNPLAYAWDNHRRYLERYGSGPREVVLVGMNPGPFGMVQTGVPFGDVAMVRDFLGIQGRTGKPGHEHPRRPVLGFGCHRKEVSGSRLWGWARDLFGTPAAFFDRFFVLNYCPLAFLAESGRNLTPDKLPAREREPLFAACDQGLDEAVELLQPRFVVGVGAFAARRAAATLADRRVVVGKMLHPSPASPRANRGWARQATRDLGALGIRI